MKLSKNEKRERKLAKLCQESESVDFIAFEDISTSCNDFADCETSKLALDKSASISQARLKRIQQNIRARKINANKKYFNGYIEENFHGSDEYVIDTPGDICGDEKLDVPDENETLSLAEEVPFLSDKELDLSSDKGASSLSKDPSRKNGTCLSKEHVFSVADEIVSSQENGSVAYDDKKIGVPIGKTTKKRKMQNNSKNKSSVSYTEDAPTKRQKMDSLNLNVSTYKLNDDTLLLTIPEGDNFYIEGHFYIRSIIGTTNIFGYTLSNKKTAVTSVHSHLIFCLECLKGEIASLKFKNIFVNSSIDTEYVYQLIREYKNLPINVVEISRYVSCLPQMISISSLWNVFKKELIEGNSVQNEQIWRDCVSCRPCNFSVDKPPKDVAKLCPSWIEYLTTVKQKITKNKKARIMVCGGTGVGKSSFVRYLVNNIISLPKFPKIALLDLDPGQPEISVPGSLSFTIFTTPLLGPPYSHRETMKVLYQRQIFYGDIAVNFNLEHYYGIINSLISDTKQLQCPLIINTIGFVSDIGTNLIVDIIRLSQPTEVVTLHSQKVSNNFEINISDSTVNELQQGFKTTHKNCKVEFQSAKLKAVAVDRKSHNTYRPQFRNLSIIGYFASLWSVGTEISSMNVTPKRVKWENFAYGHAFCPVVQSPLDLLQPFVALCYVSNSCLITTQDMKLLNHNCLWSSNSKCLGYGILINVDESNQTLDILTPLKSLHKVNAIVTSSVQLPFELAELFFKEYAEASENAYELNKNKGVRVVRKC